MNQQIKRKYAFISYNHKDVKKAKWLQKKLESYKLPTEIDNEYEESKYLRPIFLDKTDLDTGVLTEEIQKHLESSKYLIVICSTNSAEARWVSAEVEYFIEHLGRLKYVIPIIIDVKSESGKEKEHFPRYLRDYINKNPEKELLGINTDDGGDEMAFVRIVSHMLGVSFDELWKRHERERKRKIIICSVTVPVIISVLYYFVVPVSIQIKLCDERHNLIMPSEGIVEVNHVENRISKYDTIVVVRNLPGYFRMRSIPISFSANYYLKEMRDFQIGLGVKNYLSLHLHRDSTFAIFEGHIIDSQDGSPVSEALVRVEDESCKSDSNGHFRIVFPVEEQSMEKSIAITHSDYAKFSREDEHPHRNLGYMLTKK